MSECYPYITIVGVAELGFDVERPRYKRPPKGTLTTRSHPLRAAGCERLISALAGLENADPPLHLRSHETTARLLDEPSPLASRAYKHREDLIDAVICAWTGLLRLRHGFERCQVLGLTDDPSPAASIIARVVLSNGDPADRARSCADQPALGAPTTVGDTARLLDTCCWD